MQKVTVGLQVFSDQMILSDQLLSFPWEHQLPQGDIPGLQYHDVCEVAVCTEGNGFWFSEEGVRAISKGDIIFAPPYALHHTRAAKGVCKCYFVFLNEKRLLCKNGINIIDKFSEDIFAYPTIFRKEQHPKLNFLLTNFIDAAQQLRSDVAYTEKSAALWYSLFLLELQSSEKCTKRSNISDPLMPAIEKIILNFSEPLTIEDLADACQMSRNWFIKRFRRRCNTTPMRYLNDYRVKIAAQMLSESTDKIIDICEFVGYNNPSELFRNFKQRYGLSQLEYRNKTKLDLKSNGE